MRRVRVSSICMSFMNALVNLKITHADDLSVATHYSNEIHSYRAETCFFGKFEM